MTTPDTAAPAASECTCLIRHAITSQQGAQVAQALDNARATGDTTGILLALIQLTGNCPARHAQ